MLIFLHWYSIFIYIYICIHMDIYALLRRKVIDRQESNSLNDKDF